MILRHVGLLAAGALMATSSLAACSADDRRPRATPALPALAKGSEYVALGDSYTAAPGTGPIAAADGCLQSTRNYPHLLAKALNLKLTDVSCGGATTEHVTEPQIIGLAPRPPQADALSITTNLVTIGLGGNDFDNFDLFLSGCTAIRITHPTGAPCRAADTVDGRSRVEGNLARMEERLVKAIGHIANRAPNARIVVVGYPEFFPATGPCEQLPIAPGDYGFARRFNELLVRAQKRAAAQAKVEYVDVFGPSTGHHMCAKDPWIAGARPTRSDGLLYHPYPEEQRLVADLLVDLLN